MGPHAKHLYDTVFFDNPIDKPALYVNAAGAGPRKITHELLEMRSNASTLGRRPDGVTRFASFCACLVNTILHWLTSQVPLHNPRRESEDPL